MSLDPKKGTILEGQGRSLIDFRLDLNPKELVGLKVGRLSTDPLQA